MQNRLTKNRSLILVCLLSIFVIITILLITVAGFRSLPGTPSNHQGNTATFRSNDTSQSSEQKWETYVYSYDHIEPDFQISYPKEFNAFIQDANATWDITLTNNTSIIELGLSADLGADGKNVDNMLHSIVTTFNTVDISFTYTLIESGITPAGKEYSLYRISDSTGKETLAGYVSATRMLYGWPGHIAIRANSDSLLNLVKQIINTVN